MFEYHGDSDAELVARLQGAERTIAASQAEQLAVIAELTTRAPAWITTPDPTAGGAVHPVEVAAAEVAVALRISRLSAGNRTELALQVCSRLPGTLAALGRGEISMAKLRIVAEATEVLSAEHARAVEDRVLPRAEGQTPAGLGASVARAVIAADPTAAERRREQAARERTVQFFTAADGLATLWLRGPATQTMAAYHRIVDLAESARTPGDDRSAGARRADTLIDLILDAHRVGHLSPRPIFADGTTGDAGPASGAAASSSIDPAASADGAEQRCGRSHPGGAPTANARSRPEWGSRPVAVQVTVPWTTLAGLDDLPGQLAGYGPITAQAARELAADATWRRILTDPATGTVLDVGTTTYTPPAALAAHVRARDGTCRWPGCRRAARRCDLDHTVAHPRGPTAECNLEALCRPHHRLKTHTAWNVVQIGGGILVWTSPTGQRIVNEPWAAHPSQDNDPDPPEPIVLFDAESPVDLTAEEPDWLDALPNAAEIAAQMAGYDAAADAICVIDSDADADAA